MKSRRERVASNRAAGTSGKDAVFPDADINGTGFFTLFLQFLAGCNLQHP